MQRVLPALLAAAFFGVSAPPVSADATAFIGLGSAPSTRPALGVSIGAGLVIVGFEFEYAHTAEDVEDVAPSLRTYMGNVLLQTPVSISGVQLYGTVGAGAYRESFEDGSNHTNVGTNVGGGVKIRLAGPLRLRLDYRIFFLQGEPVAETPKRFYAGLNLAF